MTVDPKVFICVSVLNPAELHPHPTPATPILAQFPESFTADSVKYVTVVNHYQHCSELLMDSLSRSGITCGIMKLVISILKNVSV